LVISLIIQKNKWKNLEESKTSLHNAFGLLLRRQLEMM
jgi:hypothetical protein